METILKGYLGSLITEEKFVNNGFSIFKPSTENGKVDMIVEKNNVYYKLQIKTVQIDKGFKKIPVRKVSHNSKTYKVFYYDEKVIDFFIGVDVETRDIYIIPVEISKTYKSSISVSKVEKYKNNFNFMEPYIGNSISEHDDIGETLTDKADGNTEGMILNQPVETR